MKKIFTLILLSTVLFSCSKSESIEFELKGKLGLSVYNPDYDFSTPIGVPEYFSLLNAENKGNALQCKYGTSTCIITKSKGIYTLRSLDFGGAFIDFQMNVWSGGFELIDRHGNPTGYEK